MSKLLEKLALVQEEIKAPKSLFNKFGNYSYRSAEGILEVAKPILKKYGLILVLDDDMVEVGERVYVKATATIYDGEDSFRVSAFAREAYEIKGMSEPQTTGSASSYARKYALNGLFLLDDNKDPDSMDNGTTQSQSNNKDTLKSFCGTKKSEEGVDKDQLLKFYNFYINKVNEWKGVFNAQAQWEKWNTKS